MSRRPVRTLLEDMLERIGRIERYVAGLDLAAFLRDDKTADSVVRNPHHPARNHEIEGYLSRVSVLPGDSLTLFARTQADAYSIQVFRMGWYRGAGARLVFSQIGLPGNRQCPPTVDSLGTIECNWQPSFEFTVGPDWPSGVYLVKLVTEPDTQTQYASYALFVVRNQRAASEAVLQCAVLTYQAYNAWGGKSLYAGQTSSTDVDAIYAARAFRVSFDRPYHALGSGEFFRWEYPFLRWIERQGIEVSYITNLDLHADETVLQRHKLFFSVGHDEYWSKEMRDNVEQALRRGVSLVFLGANAAYWQVRLEPSPLGPNRRMVCYKEDFATKEPMSGGSPSLATTVFRDPQINRPEQELIGQMYVTWFSRGNYPLRVINTHTWPFSRSGLLDGDEIPGLVGYECDRVWDAYRVPSGLVKLAESPVFTEGGAPTESHVTLYTAPTSSKVFAAGTCSWSWGLDDFNCEWFEAWFASHACAHPAIDRITKNVIRELLLAGGRVQMAAVVGGVANVEVEFWENWDEEEWLDGWCDAGDIVAVGDFMALGHDQVMFINRSGTAGRLMIADLSLGKGHVAQPYFESWGEFCWLDGWTDPGDIQLVGDFMALGHDQVMFIHRSDNGTGRILVEDFGDGAAREKYHDKRPGEPWPAGWCGRQDLQLAGKFLDDRLHRLLFLRRRLDGRSLRSHGDCGVSAARPQSLHRCPDGSPCRCWFAHYESFRDHQRPTFYGFAGQDLTKK